MLTNNLLENGYHFETIEPKKYIINLLWTGFYLLLIAPALLLYFLILHGDLSDISLPYIDFSMTALNILFIAALVIYFVLKAILTVLFSSDDKNNNIDVKSAADTGIPVLVGRDAFKLWQIIVIYLTPAIITYPILILASIMSGGDINLLILIFIMTYFMSSDLLLLMYVLFLKLRYDSDYIAVKNHVYMLTLYSETYVRRKNHSERFKIKSGRFKKSIKNFNSKINAKVILIPLVIAAVVFFSINYIFTNKEKFIKVNPDDFENYLEY